MAITEDDTTNLINLDLSGVLRSAGTQILTSQQDASGATAGSLTDSTGGTAGQTLATVVRAAGIHTWGGGASTTDSISVTGILSTDIVIATMNAVDSSEHILTAVPDQGNTQVDLVLTANGADGTTKVNYLVLVGTDGDNADDNFASVADEINKLITDVDGLRTIMEAHGLMAEP